MRTLCIASGKGGTSKTTLAFGLGVYVAPKPRDGGPPVKADDRPRVAVVDLNLDQATLARWIHDRGRPVFPHLLQVTNFVDDIASLRGAGFDYCIIDTPPDELDVIETAIMEFDCVLVPVKPSTLDLSACRAVTDICRRRRKPFSIILTQVDNRTMFHDVTDAAADKCRKLGPVLPVMFTFRKAHLMAVVDETLKGKAGHEINPEIEDEIAKIWAEVEKIGRPAMTATNGRGADAR